VGTGNGTISGLIGGSASVAEVITVTFTSSTAFDVAGSVSGAIGSGTGGTPFTSSEINFTIPAGGGPLGSPAVFSAAPAPPLDLEATELGIANDLASSRKRKRRSDPRRREALSRRRRGLLQLETRRLLSVRRRALVRESAGICRRPWTVDTVSRSQSVELLD